MNQRQKRILEEVLTDPARAWALKDFLRPGVIEGVGRVTVYRDLDGLVSEGLLNPEGTTRDRAYRLNPRSDAYLQWDLSRNPGERDPVEYDPRLLDTYKPNKTYYLAEEVRKDLGRLFQADRAKVDDAAYRRVLNNLVIDLSHASSNLEEVKISWLDTKTLLELGERPGGLSERDLMIVLNHKAAIAYLVEHELRVVPNDLKDLHSLLMKDLLPNPMHAGALRTSVAYFDISTYKPISVPQQLQEQFESFCAKAESIKDPFEKSLFTMLFVPYLQPFHDGNKRTSRLAMNIPLKNARLAPFSFSHIGKRDYMFGLLAFYERGEPRFLARAFVEAYKKAAARYNDLMKLAAAGGILATVGPAQNP
jgi:hypothetical protein